MFYLDDLVFVMGDDLNVSLISIFFVFFLVINVIVFDENFV